MTSAGNVLAAGGRWDGAAGVTNRDMSSTERNLYQKYLDPGTRTPVPKNMKVLCLP